MKIKDIELLTNMNRTNIRFYEIEGFINPKRDNNGYRDYSKEDVETLNKIRFLRSLNISLENIKFIHHHSIDLNEFLKEHLNQLYLDKEHLSESIQICEQLISDRIKYDELNADSYLHSFNINNNLKEDVIKPLKAPWLRYFARTIDFSLYALVLDWILVFIFKINLDKNGIAILTTIGVLIFTFFFEPFLLSRFSTTLGKWIFGLKITDYEGNKLSYKEACDRTLNLLVHGYGLGLPFISLWTSISSYFKCDKEIPLVWEDGNIQTLKDDKLYRVFVYFILSAIIGIANLGLNNLSSFPMNRGKLTVKEFIENFNYVDSLDNFTYIMELDENGNWNDIPNTDIGNDYYTFFPKINFVTENDELVKISFHVNFYKDLNVLPGDYNNIMADLVIAYLEAQESYGAYNFEADKIAKTIRSSVLIFDDFKFEECGVIIKGDYKLIDNNKSAMDYENYTFDFSIEKSK